MPSFEGNERAYVLDCVDSSWISSAGPYITRFEEEFAQFCGVRHALTTNNGTTALHLALVALDLQPGDEVIIPTLTYIATANAVRYCNGVPVLCDIEPDTLTIDPSAIEALITPRTKGIIAVHLYGHVAKMAEISAIAKRHSLWVIEDAAEAHGAMEGAKTAGSLGTIATFSFFGNKIMTTGEGGMITTDDDELAEKVRLFRSQGMDPKRRYWFPVVGYNYRMTNIQAALGLAQLEQADRLLGLRAELAARYDSLLAPLRSKLILPVQREGTRHVYWMYTVLLADGGADERDDVMRKLDEHGIETRPVFYPMHVMPPYFEDKVYPQADLWSSRGINLPTHAKLTIDDQKRVVAALAEALG
jgi:perosamine synthetase